MKKIYLLGISILIILIVGAGFWKTTVNKSKSFNASLVSIPDRNEANYNKNVVNINTDKYVGKTALVATQGEAKVETSGTGKNAFVISINDRLADTKKNEFWEFNVNGKQAEVGAGSYIIQKGDKIEWKISTF